MAAVLLRKLLPTKTLLVVVVVVVVVVEANNNAGGDLVKDCKLDAIYQLGDSISDTGNLIRENPDSPFSHLPYGETFFNKSTGRCSNGLLIIDQFALAMELPFINPYLDKEAGRSQGVNFAVAGSTALSSEFLAKNKISSSITNSSLTTQLDWMFTYFNATCSSQTDCSEKLKSALFLVGEIGGNDYNYALLQGKTIKEVKHLVPEVVQIIKHAVTRIISYGGTRIIVPGNFPIGCLPIFLTQFKTKDSSAYNELHCLKNLNDFAKYHNKLLKHAIKSLRKNHPNVKIVYADYYHAFLWVLRYASLLEFDQTSLQKSCCGIGGDYDFNITQMCGLPGVPVCPNPDERISWDGVHFTQKAYKYIAYWLIQFIFPKLYCINFPKDQ